MIRLLLGLLLLAAPALAQDSDEEVFRFGGDAFAAGGTVILDEAGFDDVFAAGERVEIAAAIGGSAHLAARRTVSGGEVGGDLYAMGADVTVSAPVAGDASLAGYDVSVGAAIGGDLRAAGRQVRLTAPVAGSALIAGDTVSIDATITGDAAIEADTLDFGPDARIDGRLLLYGRDAAAIEVPPGVAPADRIERHPDRERPDAPGPLPDSTPGWLAIGAGFVGGAVVLAILVFLAALIAPFGMERLGARIADRPFRTFWIGFLTLAVMIGATVLAIMTIVGILAAPAIMLAIVLGCFAGYLVAVYLLGRAIWIWSGQLAPDTIGERALVAVIGAVAVSLLALVPFLGWLALLVLTLTGLGAISIALFRPEFRN
jgi:hypothetical protein